MVLFLSFAPFRFMGGAEKWLSEAAKLVSLKESVTLISVDPSISNIYSRAVLKRKFDFRSPPLSSDSIQEFSLKTSSFVPFSSSWKTVRDSFTDARLIYIKFEVLEMFIAIFFGGLGVLNKSIAGFHSPFIYASPVTFFDRLHNIIYGSSVIKVFLRKFSKLHVITKRDYNILTQDLSLKKAVYFPNIVDIKANEFKKTTKKKQLRIIFVGELIERKGLNLLKSLIEANHPQLYFNVVGDGPLKKDIQKLSGEFSNFTYHGYLGKKDLYVLYARSDVLFLPSRAEGFPVVFLEAMAHGLKILDSKEASVGLPSEIEETASVNSLTEYKRLANKIHNELIKTPEVKNFIASYYLKNYSFSQNKKKLIKAIF